MSKDFIDYYGNPNYYRAKKVAEFVLKELKQDKPIFSEIGYVVKELFKLNIEVVDMEFAGDFDFKNNTIRVSELDDKPRQIFTIAHELGHYLLHKNYCEKNKIYVVARNTLDRDNYESLEKEANVFAAYLLVPNDILVSINKEKGTLDVSYLSNHFGVSKEVIKNRINSLKIEGLI